MSFSYCEEDLKNAKDGQRCYTVGVDGKRTRISLEAYRKIRRTEDSKEPVDEKQRRKEEEVEQASNFFINIH